MKYNFDNVVDRRNTNSVKWSNSKGLEMWVADMDFHVLPEVKEALKNKLDIDAYGYSYPTDEYFDSYIEWGKKQHNLNLRREWMIFSLGVVASIDSVLKHLTKSGDEVVMLTPIYNVFYNCIRNNGCKALCCSFIYKDGEYHIDWKKLEEMLSRSTTKVLLLCNPHNPSGTIFTKDELKRMCELAVKNDCLIISDDIHCDITHPEGKYVPTLEAAPELRDHIIAMISPTKAFNLAGLQTSIIVVPNKELRETIQKGIGSDDLGDPNYFACEATIAAFKYGLEYNTELREYVFKNKQYVKDFFKKEIPGLKVVGGDATYLMWVDISAYSSDSDSFVKELKEKTGLHLASGLAYGIEGKTFVRINVATSFANVKDCCNRLKAFINK